MDLVWILVGVESLMVALGRGASANMVQLLGAVNLVSFFMKRVNQRPFDYRSQSMKFQKDRGLSERVE